VATAGDISWHSPYGTFNLRVAAILTRGEDILLCTVEGLGYWFLPGGRVRFGEPSSAALARELAEELGHQFGPGELALVVENMYGGTRTEHEIGLYYRLTWPAALDRDDLRGDEPGHRFRWAPAAELGSLPFEPARLVRVLQNPSGTLRHIVLLRADGAWLPGHLAGGAQSVLQFPVPRRRRQRSAGRAEPAIARHAQDVQVIHRIQQDQPAA